MFTTSLLKEPALPYWRLSTVYFFNCLILGLILPFWGLYLDSIGLTSSEIGISSGLLLTSTIVAPFVWQQLNYKVQNSVNVIRFGISLSFCCSLVLFKLDSFWTTSLFIFVLSFCWQGINPIMESLTLAHLDKLSHHYGQIRLWGSIGFVVSVSSLGFAFEFMSIAQLPLLLSCFMLLMLMSVLVLPGKKYAGQPSQEIGLLTTLKHSGSLGLFVAIFFAQISQGAYIGFFSLYLHEHGISVGITGNLWALAVIAEVLMFLFVYRLILKLGANKLLVISLFITAVRWLALALYVELIPILIVAQLCHAFTFSATHSAVIELIKQHFPFKNQDQGMVIYCTVCLGGGTALGSVLSGYSWPLGSSTTFAFSAIMAAIAVVIAIFWINTSPLQHRQCRSAD